MFVTVNLYFITLFSYTFSFSPSSSFVVLLNCGPFPVESPSFSGSTTFSCSPSFVWYTANVSNVWLLCSKFSGIVISYLNDNLVLGFISFIVIKYDFIVLIFSTSSTHELPFTVSSPFSEYFIVICSSVIPSDVIKFERTVFKLLPKFSLVVILLFPEYGILPKIFTFLYDVS